MASEDEISDVYEDYLDKKSDGILLATLGVAHNTERTIREKSGVIQVGKNILCEYERTQLIAMIQSIDYTGKLDSEFEDQRKTLTG